MSEQINGAQKAQQGTNGYGIAGFVLALEALFAA